MLVGIRDGRGARRGEREEWTKDTRLDTHRMNERAT